MPNYLPKFVDKQFMQFVLASGTAAAANFLSRILFGMVFSYAWSIVAAYIVGIITAFFLCKQFIFKAQQHTLSQQMTFFILVNLIAILQTLAVSLLLYDYALTSIIPHYFMRKEVAHFIGICVPVFSSYFGHKYLSFR